MESAPPTTSPTRLELEIRNLRTLQKEGRHEDVLRLVKPLTEALPENRDLLLIMASSLRHRLQIAEALEVLDRLRTIHPRFSLVHQERGLCYVALKDASPAIEALLQAVNINPALPMSWRMLEGVYRIAGDAENAATAHAHVATLKNLPPEVVHATSLFSDGEIAAAELVIRPFLLRHGDHPDAMRLLARIAIERGVLDDAETLLAALLEISPAYQAARYDYARVLSLRHRYAPAREQIERLLEIEPRNYEYRALAGSVAIGIGEHEAAIGIYEKLLLEAPGTADVWLWYAHALKTVGRVPQSIDAYRRAADVRKDFGDAYWSLANLKTYRFLDDEIARMRSAEASPATAHDDRVHLCFALGKALEDRGDFAPSWEYYARGNVLKRAVSTYRPEIFEGNTTRQKATCTREFFLARRGWGMEAREPIFIVGLPRSGSTLVEQILSSHSRVEGTQELPEIQHYVHELQGRDSDPDNPRYPAVLAEMGQDAFRALGRRYLDDTRIYRSAKPFFVDKMPNNFRHIGLIHLMLPNARIIDARREPMACCFSNLKQLFANGQEFTYSPEDIARYYRTYLDLMRHWDEVLPGRILRVHHEDVIDDLEGSVRRILDYCDLPFEPACVEFHKTKRSVRTPSSEQVRQPIFRDGLDHWQNYEPWLAPLKDLLGDALVRYRDERPR
jgi:tetratricopeptide (TPR) repeat protein